MAHGPAEQGPGASNYDGRTSKAQDSAGENTGGPVCVCVCVCNSGDTDPSPPSTPHPTHLLNVKAAADNFLIENLRARTVILLNGR